FLYGCVIKDCVLCFFFFQAEDGIRDGHVTGVQTCALPISCPRVLHPQAERVWATPGQVVRVAEHATALGDATMGLIIITAAWTRSEERRVGKECRSWWSQDHQKRK